MSEKREYVDMKKNYETIGKCIILEIFNNTFNCITSENNNLYKHVLIIQKILILNKIGTGSIHKLK